MIFCVPIACVASISVRFEARNEEPESKTARKMGQVKQQGGEGGHFSPGQNTKIPFLGLSLLRKTETKRKR